MRSVRSVVRCRSSLSNRAFSMAMTAWAAKFLTKFDLLVGKGTHFLAVQDERADQFVLLSASARLKRSERPQVQRQRRSSDCVRS